GSRLTAGAFSTRRLRATATATGPLTSPVFDVRFGATEMRLSASDESPLVYPEANGRARVELAPSPRVVDLSVAVGAPGSPAGVSASAREIQLGDGGVAARGVSVRGLGGPLELDVDLAKHRWRVVAKSDRVDLRRVAD